MEACTYSLDHDIDYNMNTGSRASPIILISVASSMPSAAPLSSHTENTTETPGTTYESVSPWCCTLMSSIYILNKMEKV